MRARNIKPGFFRNDDLAECDPLARILFAGLWCACDRKGRLEDRPKRIKADVLPYDDCNMDELLQQLHDRGFIIRYEMAGVKYIWVPTFLDHQNPHVREAESKIPLPDGHEESPDNDPDKQRVTTGQDPEMDDESTGDESGKTPSATGNEQHLNSFPTIREPYTHDADKVHESEKHYTSTVQVSDKHYTSTVLAPDKHTTNPAESLNPESLISESLNPESLNPESVIATENGSQHPNDPMTDLTETERKILNTWKSVDNYPFRFNDDLKHLRKLQVDFPDIDLLQQAMKWATYKIDEPLTKKQKPRSQFWNWCFKSSDWAKKQKGGAASGQAGKYPLKDAAVKKFW